MTIDKKMICAVNDLIAEFGYGYIATRKELLSLLHFKYDVAIGSIIPTDYCYNRINDGISLSKPALFEYIETGRYRCLGEHYAYNGSIYHKALVVGRCENGLRNVYGITDEVPQEKEKVQKGRDPSPRLRFQVLVRDKFTCRFCGASAPDVKLHIDHIFPWSKGGKTCLSNLQTLCSTCNLGKSDIVVE